MVTSELLEKAKNAETSEELLTLAKENGVEMTAEEAKEYFDQLHKSGELSDEELDNVAGGGCHAKDGRLVVTAFYGCEHWACHLCGDTTKYNAFTGGEHCHVCKSFVPAPGMCKSCKYMERSGARWLCNYGYQS